MTLDSIDPLRGLFSAQGGDGDGTEHLDDQGMAALLDADSLDGADPGSVAHLAACDACRREWTRLRRDAAALAGAGALAEVPWEIERKAGGRDAADSAGTEPRARPWRVLAGAGAALVLAGLALLVVPRDTVRGPDVMRSERGAAPLDPLSPEGAVAASPPPEFRWVAVPGATAYEVVVADAVTGETVLRLRSASASRRLSDDERSRLEPGRSYRWLVRAERGVGRTSTGAAARFRMTPK